MTCIKQHMSSEEILIRFLGWLLETGLRSQSSSVSFADVGKGFEHGKKFGSELAKRCKCLRVRADNPHLTCPKGTKKIARCSMYPQPMKYLCCSPSKKTHKW